MDPNASEDSLRSNREIEQCIARLEDTVSQERIWDLLHAFQRQCRSDGRLLLPVIGEKADIMSIPKLSLDPAKLGSPVNMRKVELAKGGMALCAFTSEPEMEKGELTESRIRSMEQVLRQAYEEDDVMGILINPWGTSVLLDKKLLDLILHADAMDGAGSGRESSSSVYLDLADLTSQKTDAVVNAAPNPFAFHSGCGQALLKACGPSLMDECPVNRPLKDGQALLMPVDHQPFGAIIHTALPLASECADEQEMLAQCMESVLDCAKEHGLHSLAVPAIGTGYCGYDPDWASAILVLAAASWFNRNPEYDLDLTFVCADREDYQRFYQILFDEEDSA